MIREIKKLAREKGYTVFTQPYFLNLWGFRANSNVPNAFDDELHAFMNIGTEKRPKWVYYVFRCTTDPGTYWLKNPMNVNGTAILHPGQYPNSHSIGLHKGQYKALVQTGAMWVIRDYNRDAVLDFNSGKVFKGLYGINIHHSNSTGESYLVDKWSAGCQVFKNIKDYDFFMNLAEVHRKYHGNKFTYTLVDKRMEYRSKLKTIGIASVLVGLLVGGYYFITSNEKEFQPF